MSASGVVRGAALTAFAASAFGIAALAKEADAPQTIPMTRGEWDVRTSAEGRGPFAGKASLRYLAPVFPRLSLHLMRFQCEFPGNHRIEVTGLLPAQSFPQPEVTIAIGSESWSATPDALYRPRSEARRVSGLIPNSMLDENMKGKDISWPGHPPHATLSFWRPSDPELLRALTSGEEIRIDFDSQERVLPPIPRHLATRYADACTAMTPPVITAGRDAGESTLLPEAARERDGRPRHSGGGPFLVQ